MNWRVRTICDYISDDGTLLSFRQGEVLEVSKHEKTGMLEGIIQGRKGLISPQCVISVQVDDGVEKVKHHNELFMSQWNAVESKGILSVNRKYSASQVSEYEGPLSFEGSLYIIKEEDSYPVTSSDQSISSDYSHYTEALCLILSECYNEIIPDKYLEVSDDELSLPLFWGCMKTEKDVKYYFNIANDITTWDLPEQGSLNEAIYPSRRSSHSIDIAVSKDSDGSDTFYDALQSREGITEPILLTEATEIEPNFGSIYSNILASLNHIGSATRTKSKLEYIQHTNNIIQQIQFLLTSINITNNDDSLLKSNLSLQSHYIQLIKRLTNLILDAKKASKIWPSPDDQSNLFISMNELVVSLRYFLSEVRKCGIEIQPKIAEEVTEKNEDKSDIISNLGDIAFIISSDVRRLEHLKKHGSSEISDLSKVIQNIMFLTGGLLSQLNLIQFGADINKCVKNFITNVKNLYEQTGNLIVAFQDMSYPNRIEKRAEAVWIAASNIESTIYKLYILAKFIQEDNDQYQYDLLKKEIDHLQMDFESNLEFLNHRYLNKLYLNRNFNLSFNSYDNNDNGEIFILNDPVGNEKKENSLINSNNQRSLSLPTSEISNSDHSRRLSFSIASTQEEIQSFDQNTLNEFNLTSNTTDSNSNNSINQDKSALFSDGSTISLTRSRSIQQTQKPWFLEHSYSEDNILISDNTVKGGTLSSLIERLTSHDYLDTSFNATFLLTYRSFTTTMEFFDLLFRRFNLQCPNGLQPDEQDIWVEKKLTPVRLRVFNIMKIWLDTYYNEEEDQSGIEKLRQFACTTMNEVMSKSASHIVQLISKRRESGDMALRRLVLSSRSAPQPILPKNFKKMKLVELNPLEIARQLTLIDSNNYIKIKPAELLNKAWTRKDANGYVKIMTDMSNKVTRWVADSILSQKDPKKRVMIIKYFTQVMEKLEQLNNFNSLMAIIAGFTVAPIFRLKRTWDMVSPKTLAIFEEYKAKMDTSLNYAKYREQLRSLNPPCVPFLGIYLKDLTFIHDGNPDYMPYAPHLINFSKYTKTAGCILEVQQFQHTLYSLESVNEIQDFITKGLDDAPEISELYETSLQLEPKEEYDEMVARMLHEAGFY